MSKSPGRTGRHGSVINRKRCHPLAPALSSKKTPNSDSSFQGRTPASPLATIPALVRAPVFGILVACLRARTSHPSGSRHAGRSWLIRPEPLVLFSTPENRRCPSASISPTVLRQRSDGCTGTWLPPARAAPTLSGSRSRRTRLQFRSPVAIACLVFSLQSTSSSFLMGSETAAQSESVARNQTPFRARRPVPIDSHLMRRPS